MGLIENPGEGRAAFSGPKNAKKKEDKYARFAGSSRITVAGASFGGGPVRRDRSCAPLRGQ